jgi:hypothetical protein
MHCYICTLLDQDASANAVVAICKQCGAAVCHDHLHEEWRQGAVGMISSSSSSRRTLLCLDCAGLTLTPASAAPKVGARQMSRP